MAADPLTPVPGADHAVLEAAKVHAYDDYLAALLAPQSLQSDLIILAAYFGDVRRIPLIVSETALGEIRLQWWRDTIQTGSGGGHPVADALIDAMQRRGWSADTLIEPLEAHAVELYADPLPDAAAFSAYAAGLERAHVTLRAQTYGVVESDSGTAALQSAAYSLGLVRLLLRLPLLMSKGRLPLPQDRFLTIPGPATASSVNEERAVRSAISGLIDEAETSLDDAKKQIASAPAVLRQSLISLALGRPYLRAMRRRGYDPLHHIADISPITRVWTLWRAKAMDKL